MLIRIATLLTLAYLVYYTLLYAKLVWTKEKNLLASVFIALLSLALIAVPVWLNLRH